MFSGLYWSCIQWLGTRIQRHFVLICLAGTCFYLCSVLSHALFCFSLLGIWWTWFFSGASFSFTKSSPIILLYSINNLSQNNLVSSYKHQEGYSGCQFSVYLVIYVWSRIFIMIHFCQIWVLFLMLWVNECASFFSGVVFSSSST